MTSGPWMLCTTVTMWNRHAHETESHLRDYLQKFKCCQDYYKTQQHINHARKGQTCEATIAPLDLEGIWHLTTAFIITTSCPRLCSPIFLPSLWISTVTASAWLTVIHYCVHRLCVRCCKPIITWNPSNMMFSRSRNTRFRFSPQTNRAGMLECSI